MNILKGKKVIYLIRHGQSEDNLRPVFQSKDSPLSPLGIKQAKLMAKRIKDVSPEVVYSSPYPRALDTAKIIAKELGQDLIVKDFLKELVMPKCLDGKFWEDPQAAQDWKSWEKTLTNLNLKFKDGENYAEIVFRAQKILKFLEKLPQQKIALVSHGYLIRTIIFKAVLKDNLNPKILENIQTHIKSENTGISILYWDNDYEQDFSFRLFSYNDHSHFTKDIYED